MTALITQTRSISPDRGTILIVDDNAENLGFLFDYFLGLDYKVLVAPNGVEALKQVELVKPDIILLDVMMPEIDGFETCKRLKANPDTSDIPVIFMTALSSPGDKVKGFEVGGDDYVTKPVNKEEVHARVNTHLSRVALRRELQERNQELKAFSRMVAHNLKDPLTTIIARTELILDEWAQCGRCGAGETFRDLALVRDAGGRMRETIHALLTLAGISQGDVEIQAVDMGHLIDEVCQDMQELIDARDATVTYPDSWPAALGNPAWVKQVWSNYISNGLKYGGDPPELELGVERDQGDMLRFWVRDNGVGVPEDAAHELFEPFTRLHTTLAHGHGLGLSIVRRIVQRLGGQVGARPRTPQGSEFYFTLPRA